MFWRTRGIPDLLQRGFGRVRTERRTAGQDRVQDGAQSVDVAQCRRTFAARLLRRHVARGADNRAVCHRLVAWLANRLEAQLVGPNQRGQTEVADVRV